MRQKHEVCEVLQSLHLLTLKLKVTCLMLITFGWCGKRVLQDFVLQSTSYPIILALVGHYYIVELSALELKH